MFRKLKGLSAVAMIIASHFSLAQTSQIAPGLTKRYIIQHNDEQSLTNRLHKMKFGSAAKRMTHMNAYVTQASPEEIETLSQELPGLAIAEDIEVHANSWYYGSTSNPPQQIPWGMTRIKASSAYAYTKGRGIKVCVVDTGISKSHPDLKANIIGGRNFVLKNGYLDSRAWDDDNGHGSHVSGIIAALDNRIGTIGVAPLASLYGVKVLNSQGTGYLSDAADGVLECVRIHANVINMSLSANSDPNLDSPLKTAINTARAAGIYVVVAAGNSGTDVSTTVPAGYSNVIAVAATDSNNTIPSWSNYGLNTNDFAAPGVNVYSTWKGTGYNTISGTSMASPHVAGAIALVLAARKSKLSTDDLKYPISYQGAGLINLQKTFAAP